MLSVRRLLPEDWMLYRELRLAALADAPDAFCSTLADAVARPEAEWRERLERADPDTNEPLVATLDGVSCGLALVAIDRTRPDVAELFQMWVAPQTRGHGVGRCLVEHVIDWATVGRFRILALECQRDNPSARRLYERCGFVIVGDPRPIREGSNIVAVAMERHLARELGTLTASETGPGMTSDADAGSVTGADSIAGGRAEVDAKSAADAEVDADTDRERGAGAS